MSTSFRTIASPSALRSIGVFTTVPSCYFTEVTRQRDRHFNAARKPMSFLQRWKTLIILRDILSCRPEGYAPSICEYVYQVSSNSLLPVVHLMTGSISSGYLVTRCVTSRMHSGIPSRLHRLFWLQRYTQQQYSHKHINHRNKLLKATCISFPPDSHKLYLRYIMTLNT